MRVLNDQAIYKKKGLRESAIKKKSKYAAYLPIYTQNFWLLFTIHRDVICYSESSFFFGVWFWCLKNLSLR